MDTQTLLQADYLDIIFDQRNKKYGGYELRKHYTERTGKALAFLLSGVGILIYFSFVVTDHRAVTLARPIPADPYVLTHYEKLPVLPPRFARPDPPPVDHVKTVMRTTPVITDDPIKPEQQMQENKTLANAQPGATNSDGLDPGIAPGNNDPAGTGVIKPAETDDKLPKIWVGQMPRFIGDMNGYINSHIRYPDAAREANIEGTVVVRFVVNEDGSVSDATVVRGIGGGCDEEALRMVMNMPKWVPGKQNGLAVKVFFSLPIKFVLN